MKIWKALIPLLVLNLFAASCVPFTAQAAKPIPLTVMAAASLTESFKEVAQSFQQAHPGVTVQFNFAGSQQLVQQLSGGAPADVFASASPKTMQDAVKTGRIDPSASRVFARNRLVIITPTSNPAGLSSPPDLAKTGLKLVLAAKEVPVGQYSLNFMDQAGKDPAFGPQYKDRVLKNVVSYETDVKAVVAKISLGEADAGIVYTTDAASTAGKVKQIAIPDSLNVVASYPAAVIKDSANSKTAAAFLDFLLSPTGQAILAKYGFLPPQ